MTWTYDPTLMAAQPIMQIRYLVGDTLPKDPQIQDEELAWVLSQRSSIYGAAADACRSLSARLSREADSSQGPLRTSYSGRARAYAARASQYDIMAITRLSSTVYSGQTSVTDYQQIIMDANRINGQFAIGMTDNLEIGGEGTVGPVDIV